MQLFYDDIALHDLGTLFVSAQETHRMAESLAAAIAAKGKGERLRIGLRLGADATVLR